MAYSNALIKHTAMKRDAEARAAKLKLAEMARITTEKKSAEFKSVAATKHTFEVISEKHRHKMQKIMDEEMTKERTTAETAHFNKATAVASALTITKSELSSANNAHKAALALAFTTYASSKTAAETASAALEAKLKKVATDANTAKVTEVGFRYNRHKAAAVAAHNAALATAKAVKQDADARADSETKEAEMSAWVDTMAQEVTAATWCSPDGFTLTAAGNAKASGGAAPALIQDTPEDTSEY